MPIKILLLAAVYLLIIYGLLYITKRLLSVKRTPINHG
jgi:hypothetical protein